MQGNVTKTSKFSCDLNLETSVEVSRFNTGHMHFILCNKNKTAKNTPLRPTIKPAG
jgi:hypothetical protein